jgi:ubiquinone/menaquinone biosynthesis C-methylase UbiE
MDPLIRREIDNHYTELYNEAGRLDSDGMSRIELIRTKEIIQRLLPPPPARLLDVGGGPGVYSLWLADLGYEVALIDAVALHVEHAVEAGVDGFLLLGPLYHLQERGDRLAALTEARRVLRPDSRVFAVGITRFASAIDGFESGFIDHDHFEQIVHVDLETGKHSNDTGDPRFFTTAYFHRPDELVNELKTVGFTEIEMLAVEGMSWAAHDLDERVADPAKLRAVLDLLRRLEAEEALLGATPHFLATGKA